METSPKNPPKYIMATILMPIQVNNLEEDDFVCLQEHAKVSLEFCKDLPITKEGEQGYSGLADKIHELYENFREEPEKEMEKGGVIEKPPKRVKHNITYRHFRENEKSHRYTFRNLS
jgi:hypothetical protein